MPAAAGAGVGGAGGQGTAGSSSGASTCAGEIDFVDPTVEAAVRQAAGVPSGPLTGAAVQGVTELVANGASSLAGVECLPQLDLLVATNGLIQDLSPLRDLANLRSVTLRGNRIQDASPLSRPGRAAWRRGTIDLSSNQLTSLQGLDLPPAECSALLLDGNALQDQDVQSACDQQWYVRWDAAPGARPNECNQACLN
jgi:hypothetical protein